MESLNYREELFSKKKKKEKKKTVQVAIRCEFFWEPIRCELQTFLCILKKAS